MVNFYYNFSGPVAVIKVGQMDFIIVGQRALYFPLSFIIKKANQHCHHNSLLHYFSKKMTTIFSEALPFPKNNLL